MKTPSIETLLERLGDEKRIHYSLENLKLALAEAGHPEKTVKSIVIAGTNGKGTTSLLISRALELEGYHVATTLSPHLQSLNERFLDHLKPWSSNRLESNLQKVLSFSEKQGLSYFESLILAFFMDSAHEKPDFNVLEVGMGGRLDATNVTDPQAVVLTNISWDHADYLGDSLEKILREKMGVFRKKTPVVTGMAISSPLYQSLKAECERLESPLFSSQEISRKVISKSWQGQEVEIDHQAFFLKNAATAYLENAVTAYCFLKQNFPEIPLTTLQRAFSSVTHPGRLEVVRENPQIILSGDHNEAGVQGLVQTLQELNARNLFILCGFSPDKKAKNMIEALKPFSQKLILTEVPGARGVYPQSYSSLAPFEKNPETALRGLLGTLGNKDTLLITGSLYLVGHLRGHWKKEVAFFSP